MPMEEIQKKGIDSKRNKAKVYHCLEIIRFLVLVSSLKCNFFSCVQHVTVCRA